MSRRCNRSDQRAHERKLARTFGDGDPAFYKSADWLRIRARQLSRQPLCEACDPPRPAAHVDHIKRIRDGGAKREPSNLMSLCASCHNTKSRLEQAGRRWVMPKHRGCDARGTPRDPTHPWHAAELALAHGVQDDGGGVGSRQSGSPGTSRLSKTELD